MEKLLIKQVAGKQGTWALCKVVPVTPKTPQGLKPLIIDTNGTDFLVELCKAENWAYLIVNTSFVYIKN